MAKGNHRAKDANSHSFSTSVNPCGELEYHVCLTEECGGTFSGDPLPADCDPNGCDFNPYRMGARDFYGQNKTVDTTKIFT